MSGATSSTVVMEEAASLYEMVKELKTLEQQWYRWQCEAYLKLTDGTADKYERQLQAHQLCWEAHREIGERIDALEVEIAATVAKHGAIVAAGWAGQHERDAWLSGAASEVTAKP
jgi:hypothetical protein